MGPFSLAKLAFLLLCLFAYSSVTLAQETYSDEELEAMSDEELELICVVRGFELVKDHVNEETGEVYTLQHMDYVTAAKQCLSIENEMNEILEEHPELREELEEEIIKMQKEQEARRAELEKLQQQVLESEDAGADSATESAAFIGKANLEEVKEEVEESAPSETETQQTVESEILEEETEEESEKASAVEDEEEIEEGANSEDQTTEESTVQSTPDNTEGLEISDEERVPLNEEEEAALAEQEEIPDELTMEYLRVEFIKYVKKDIERLTRILVPILKPMLNAGDLAIRYIRAALSTLREAYNSQNNQADEKEA